MNQKKIIQIIIISVAAIWLACIVTVISVKVARRNQPEITTLPDLTTISQTAFSPATTAQSTTANPQLPTINGNNITSTAQVDDPQWLISQRESEKVSQAEANIPKTKTEVIGAYLTAVNDLKETKRFTLVKANKFDIQIDEMTPSSIKTIASKIISSNTNDAPVTYRFANGVDAANPEDAKSPNQVIAPLEKSASLDEKHVKSASAKKGSNGSYTLTIKMTKQKQTLNTEAPGYSTVMDPINVETLGMPSSAKISKLDIVYDNSTITATIDKDGKITSMKHYLEVVSSDGEGTYLLSDVTIKMHGSCTTTYQISY